MPRIEGILAQQAPENLDPMTDTGHRSSQQEEGAAKSGEAEGNHLRKAFSLQREGDAPGVRFFFA
jgi:hypothetical protein